MPPSPLPLDVVADNPQHLRDRGPVHSPTTAAGRRSDSTQELWEDQTGSFSITSRSWNLLLMIAGFY